MKNRNKAWQNIVSTMTVLSFCAAVGTVSAQVPAGVGAIGAPAEAASAPEAQPAAEKGVPAAEAEITGEPQKPVADIIPIASDDAAVQSIGSSAKELINVSVENESLENIVTMFTRISGANLVTSSADLEGTVTVNLKGVDWKSALSAILDIHDLALVERVQGSGVYTIVPRPPESEQPLIVDTIFLHFTTVPEVQPLVRSMLAPVSNANITAFASRNAMVVKTTEPNMTQIKQMIETMDVPGDQVVVETKFIELSDNASKRIGLDWSALRAFNMGFTIGPWGEQAVSQENRSRSTARNFENSRIRSDENGELTERLFDVNGNQYEITDTEFIDDDGDPLTPPLQQTDIVPTTTKFRDLSDRDFQNESFTDDILNTFSKTISKAESAILDVDTLNVVLSALHETDGVEVISNPKIVVASGAEDAYFSVGDREPIIRTERQSGTEESPGDTLTSQLDTGITTDYITQGYLATGIGLKVVPVVKTEELIEASIEPSLIVKTGSKQVGDNSWPIISVKELKTVFTLRSGQTVAIGGLTDTQDFNIQKKVPLLGDIPFVGKYLFSHTTDEKRRVETVIFVTLSIADPELIYDEVGIPTDAELIHRQRIRKRNQREQFETELEDLEKAAIEESSRRARSRLLQRTE